MRLASAFLVFFLLAQPAAAETSWVNLKDATGTTHKALLALPEGPGKHPGLIFHHDTNLRKQGYERGREHGFDLKVFATALAGAGFVTLAPLRRHGRFKPDAAYVTHRALTDGPPLEFRTAIKEGLESHNSAMGWLGTHANMDASRISVVGLGEGALIALWAAGDKRLAAALLISPTKLRKARHLSLKLASDKARIKHLALPVFLAMSTKGRRGAAKIARLGLLPALKARRLGKVWARLDYPGANTIFYQPRGVYWGDVVGFLKQHLGGG
ncbi:MAG: hypothetical protein QGF09_11285 [Rhodospirillales bacterium]|nr:hypothetical protein [Rhodospirillales bacterium]